jgi:hypothetical protein
MQPRTGMLSAFTLSTAMFFGTAAMAADLPKEGTFNASYYGFGTYKATPIGKERLLFAFDENGLSLGDGLYDHVTWHCSGLAEFANEGSPWPGGAMGAPHGFCVGTDPAGDKISGEFVHEKHRFDEKNIHASFTFTAGTGKYAGISGGHTYVAHVFQYRTADEGTYAIDFTCQGSYKLP